MSTPRTAGRLEVTPRKREDLREDLSIGEARVGMGTCFAGALQRGGPYSDRWRPDGVLTSSTGKRAGQPREQSIAKASSGESALSAGAFNQVRLQLARSAAAAQDRKRACRLGGLKRAGATRQPLPPTAETPSSPHHIAGACFCAFAQQTVPLATAWRPSGTRLCSLPMAVAPLPRAPPRCLALLLLRQDLFPLPFWP
jgi:hypothetical protein